MTDLTAREMLDAVQRGMEETWRQIDGKKAAEAGRKLQQGQASDHPAAKDNAAKSST